MINSRQQLKDYALRALGHPVIRVNVDNLQLEDRIDDALTMFNEYHFDGAQLTFLKHQITEDDIENGYITVPLQILSVLRALSFNRHSIKENLEHRAFISEIMDFRRLINTGLHGYVIGEQYRNTINQFFTYEKRFEYNRYTNKLTLDTDWKTEMKVDDYLIIEAWTLVSPEEYGRVWNDKWLRDYTICLFKYQWGTNMVKYGNAQLPGGITLNGEMIYNEAKQEKEQLEERLRLEYSDPPTFFVG